MIGSATAEAVADLALRMTAALTLYTERVTGLGTQTRDCVAAYRAVDESTAAELRRLVDQWPH